MKKWRAKNPIPSPTNRLVLYSPHAAQYAFHCSTKRFRVAIQGRQSGKSTMCNNELIRRAWETPNTAYGYISPIYAQSKEQYRRLLKMIPREILRKKSDSELRADLINNSYIEYLSGDNPDSLRGRTYHGAVIDETKDQDPTLWPMVVRPMLATTKGWCAFVGTPNGFDALYDLYNQAQTNPLEWDTFKVPSTANPLFTQEEFEAAKRSMSELQFQQEILAEFVNMTNGKAYINFGQHNLTETNPFCLPNQKLNPYLPIIVGCDFNITPMCWTLSQNRADDFYFFDEIYLEGSHTQEASRVLVERIKQCAANGLKAVPQVVIAGDATSKASQRASAGQSDYDILHSILNDAKISWSDFTPNSNPTVKDRVNNFNQKLKAADGSVHCFINPKTCTKLVRDLERVVWKESGQAILDQTTDKLLTHMSDGAGYAMWSRSPLKGVNQVGGLKMIHRVT